MDRTYPGALEDAAAGKELIKREAPLSYIKTKADSKTHTSTVKNIGVCLIFSL